MKRKIFILIILFILTFCLGCWDLKEIEKRGYVIGLALDSYEEVRQQIKPFEQMTPYDGRKKYLMTVQIPIWKKGQLLKSDGSGGSKGESATWEMSVPGNSILEMSRELSLRNNYQPFYEDIEVVVISQDIASKGIDSWLDAMLRGKEFRRTVKVFVAKGKAKDIFAVIPKIESYPSIYLSNLAQYSTKTSKMVANQSLGNVSQFFYNGMDYALPMVQKDTNELKSSGAAIIRNNQMVGELNEIETEAFNMLINKYKGGVITFPCWQHPEEQIAIEIQKLKTKIVPKIVNGQVNFQISVNVEGSIVEVSCIGKHESDQKSFLDQVKKASETTIQQNILATLNKLQGYQADATQLIEKVREKEYPFWKENKNRWRDTFFPQSKFDVKAQTKIYLVGDTK